MSLINKHYRRQWIATVYAQAVTLFHEARKCSENEDVPLHDLARQSANTAFQEAAMHIIGDKETMAKEYMAHCRDHFATEIQAAIEARARADIETAQTTEVLVA